jgi:16S rRNA U516 pseudouridylate synthase RsuA-like enzyme
VEVKVAGTKGDDSGPETCALEVVLAEGRRIEVRRNFDAETLHLLKCGREHAQQVLLNFMVDGTDAVERLPAGLSFVYN